MQVLTRPNRVQAHPEYTSKVLDPSPTYLGFVAASAGCLDQMIEQASHKKDGLTNRTGGASHF
jgi:CTP synthase